MGSDNSKGSRSLPQGQRAHPDIKSVSHRLGNDQEIRVKKIYHVSKPIERPPTPPPPEPVPVMIVQQPVQRLVKITRPAPQPIIQMAHPTMQQVVHVATPPRQIIHTMSPTVNEFRRPVILSQGNQDILRISRLE
jgi:hypothetical protein